MPHSLHDVIQRLRALSTKSHVSKEEAADAHNYLTSVTGADRAIELWLAVGVVFPNTPLPGQVSAVADALESPDSSIEAVADGKATPLHRQFLSLLRDSEKSVLHVARWLRRSGCKAAYSPPIEAPNKSEWKSHVDDGDLTISLKVEVKRLSRTFSDHSNWPFKDVIVCAKHAWDDANPKPFAFLYLNQPMTHAAMLLTSTRPKWWPETRGDIRRPGYTEKQYYITKKHMLSFHPLNANAPWPFGMFAHDAPPETT